MGFKNFFLISGFLAFTTVASAQSSSGILSPDRAIDWSQAGVTGGIPNRTTICATLNPGVTVSQINSAISACPAGQVVLLNPGTYNLGTSINLSKDNVTLRGAGADQTKLRFTGRGGTCNAAICATSGWIQGGYGSTPQNLANWTAGYAKGTNVITLSSTANLSVGTTMYLEQLDDTADTGEVYICNVGGKCAYTTGGGEIRGNRNQRQMVRVAAINGNQVTLTSPLHMPNWRASQSPTARWAGAPRVGVGLEDMTVDFSGASNSGGGTNIYFLNTTDSWIRGVRSIMAERSHINLYQAHRTTIRDSYLYGTANGVSQSYGIELFGASSDILIENNLIQHNTAPYVANDGGSNIVFGYNFSIDNQRSDVPSLMSATFHVHSPGTSYVLLEGNDGLAMVNDDWYGTVHFVTSFRNHFYGDIFNSPVKSSQTQIMQIAAYSRFFNFVGNVLGRTGYYSVYEPSGSIGCGNNYIYCFGYSHANGGVVDALTKPTALRWGNYDTVTGSSRFLASEIPSGLAKYSNQVPASQALPASFYMSSKPSWFGSLPFPAVGPDVTGGTIAGYAGHAYKIPARSCWENSPIDSAFGSLNIRSFSRTNCFGSGGSQPPPPPPPPANVAPSVSIASPSSGASFTAGASIAINANASDSDGSISKVEFFNGSTKLGEDLTSPYSFTMSNAAAGSYSLVARATDDDGAVTSSAAVSITVNAVTPPPPASLAAPSNLRVVSVAYNKVSVQWDYSGSGQSGFIVNRKLGSSGTLAQVGTTAALSYDDSSVSASSTYCYQVKAYNSSMQSAASNEICADTSAAPVNLAPSVSITSPSNGSSFSAGSSISISASAFDSDGSISKVEFFNGSTKLGEDLSAPYSLTMSNAAAGSYNLTARATDNAGAIANSAAVSITVNAVTQPPPSGASVTLLTSQVPAQSNLNDGVSYELGMRFTSTAAGKITAIRFLKASSETGTHTGKIYSSSGALLAAVVFSSETASGWQQMNLASPLSIAANTEYTVSVNTGAGYYVATNNGMASQISNGSLRSVVGNNGVYGSVGSRPTNSYENSNYFRDIVFIADSGGTTPPPPAGDVSAPVASITSPVNGSQVTASSTVSIQASASDDVGVVKVEFYVNGTLKCTDSVAPYSCNWAVSRRIGRTHQLQVKAYDASGKVGNSAIVSVTSK